MILLSASPAMPVFIVQKPVLTLQQVCATLVTIALVTLQHPVQLAQVEIFVQLVVIVNRVLPRPNTVRAVITIYTQGKRPSLTVFCVHPVHTAQEKVWPQQEFLAMLDITAWLALQSKINIPLHREQYQRLARLKLRSAHKLHITTYGIRAHVSTALKVITAERWEPRTTLLIAHLAIIVPKHRRIRLFVQQERTTQRQTHGQKVTALTVLQGSTVPQRG